MQIKQYLTLKNIVIGGSLVCLILVSNYFVWHWAIRSQTQDEIVQENERYHFLNPRLRSLERDERHSKAFVTLLPLKDKILQQLSQKETQVGLYVEDLNTGAWVGLKEKDEFIPASLLKVPTAIAAMKEVEKGVWTLNKEIALDPKYKDSGFGNLWQEPNYKKFTVQELLIKMLAESDNTAYNMLYNNISQEELDNVYFHIGMKNLRAARTDQNGALIWDKISPRDLSTMFRALYNATHLTRESSNFLLQIMTETQFDDLVAPEIPADVKIAHKIGAFYETEKNIEKNYHDCGIGFVPEHAYLYCFMTTGLDVEDAKQTIRDLSQTTLDYFYNNGKEEVEEN